MTSTAQRSTTLFDDAFTGGLDLATRWHILEGPGGAVDDGVATTTGNGLSVSPPRENPRTGEPAFSRDVSGPMTHLKWLATTADAFPRRVGNSGSPSVRA